MHHVYLCNKVVNNQTPSPRLGVSLLRENTNIFTNVSYLCILHICVDKIYNSMTLFKGIISYKILVWSQSSLPLKELTIFIYFELAKCGPVCFTTISIVVFFSTAACSRVAKAMFVALACIVIYAAFLHVQLTICMQPFGTRYHALVLHLPMTCCQRRNPDPLKPGLVLV